MKTALLHHKDLSAGAFAIEAYLPVNNISIRQTSSTYTLEFK
jgi:hypothetical protein